MALLSYNDTLLPLQYKDSVNGMLRMQKTGMQKVYEGFPILQQRMPWMRRKHKDGFGRH